MRIEEFEKEMQFFWKDLKIKYFSELTSTNDYVKSYLKEKNNDEILVLSKKQSAGRGRRGRDFYSKLDQGLYFSLGIKISELNSNDLTLYTILTATALIQAVDKELNLKLKVKWVNDLFFQGKKVAGILSEAITNPQRNKIDFLVLGLGLNLAGSFSEADQLTQKTAGTLYDELPEDFNLKNVMKSFLIYFKSYHENLRARSFIPFYEDRLIGIEKEVYYFKKGKKYTGRIKGINEKGQLLIKNKRDDLEKLIASEIHFSSQQFT